MKTLIEANWLAPKNIHALTTTRYFAGISKEPYDTFNLADYVCDNMDIVGKNRLELQELLSLPSQPCWISQQHTNVVTTIDNYLDKPSDGFYTNKERVVCAILTADCLPILICNKAGSEVAALHAGWRGLASGIIENGVKYFSCKSEDILVWLGPAIGPDVFKVSSDVRDAFLNHDPANSIDAFSCIAKNEWLCDLYQIAKKKFHCLGVTKIYGGDYCTYSQPELFFSFRRNNISGRMASLIWME